MRGKSHCGVSLLVTIFLSLSLPSLYFCIYLFLCFSLLVSVSLCMYIHILFYDSFMFIENYSCSTYVIYFINNPPLLFLILC